MNKEGMEELLVIGEDVFEEVSVDEHDDYIIVPDPENDDEDAWAVLILRGKYENFVIRFENVAINTETEEMTFGYNILATGVENQEVEYDQIEFTNMCSAILSKVIADMHANGTQSYYDLETGEAV